MYYGYSTELYHHGVKGQKWGYRRWQYENGSLTPEGRIHYGYGNVKTGSIASTIKSIMHPAAKITITKRGSRADFIAAAAKEKGISEEEALSRYDDASPEDIESRIKTELSEETQSMYKKMVDDYNKRFYASKEYESAENAFKKSLDDKQSSRDIRFDDEDDIHDLNDKQLQLYNQARQKKDATEAIESDLFGDYTYGSSYKNSRPKYSKSSNRIRKALSTKLPDNKATRFMDKYGRAITTSAISASLILTGNGWVAGFTNLGVGTLMDKISGTS